MKNLYTAAAFTILCSMPLSAQVNVGGTPWSLRHDLDRSGVPTVHTTGIDRAEVDASNAHRAEEGKVPSDARLLPVEADLATSGTWVTLPNGDGVWRLHIESPGALATELFFRDFHLPAGGVLHIFDDSGEHVLGGFTGYHNKDNGLFATAALAGEACFVEYYEPAEVRGEGEFIISSLGHTYRHLSGGSRAGDCEVDVNCSEGDGWEGQRDGTVKVRIVDGSEIGFCSGGLMNNLTQDCSAYILTAHHCGPSISAADFLLWKFYFRYQRSGCGSGSASQSRVITGCVKRGESNDNGGNSGSDFLLLEAEDAIPDDYWPYWMGWDATTNTHVGGKCVHHPNGDEKKISTYTATAQNSTQWNGLNTHYRITWVGTANGWGVTEGGSSGSPLFESTGKVIGTLTGGGSYCNSVVPGGQTQPDWFGRMNYHWTSNGGPATEDLKAWLDPNNTGTLVMEGSYGPCGTLAVQESATLEKPLLSPNPAMDQVNIKFPSGIDRADRIQVLDIAGRMVISEVPMTIGSTDMELGNLGAGTYFVRLLAGSEAFAAVKLEVLAR